MGWWSTSVLGGDGPLDMVWKIESEILGVGTDEYDEPEQWAAEIKQVLDEKIHILASDEVLKKLTYYEDSAVAAAQVLGAFVMEHGADPNNEHTRKILDRARKAAVDDEWAREHSERLNSMREFIQQIDAYDGHPTNVKNKSLLEAFAEHINSNGPDN